MDLDRIEQLRAVEARLTLSLPDWVVSELERHSLDHPHETLDHFVSEQIRRWAERRRAERSRAQTPSLRAVDR